MQPDIESLRRRYAGLSDEALLAIDRAELTGAAQNCYDGEIAKRGLRAASGLRRSPRPSAGQPDDQDHGESEAAEPLDAEGPDDWLADAMEVYSLTFFPGTDVGQLEEARKSLESAGIPFHVEWSDVVDEDTGQPVTPPRQRGRILVPGHLNLLAASTLDRDIFNDEFESAWRNHLEVLSDDEVLEMTPEVVFCGLYDRIERAVKAYEDELARRGLADEAE
jgi:hypothetical protein